MDGVKIDNPSATIKFANRKNSKNTKKKQQKMFVNSLKQKHITCKEKLEESRRALIYNSFIGNYLHTKLHINALNITKVINNCTTMSTTFDHK